MGHLQTSYLPGPADDTIPLTKDYDDVCSSNSEPERPEGKSRGSFTGPTSSSRHVADLEDGFVARRNSGTKTWWNYMKMVIRSRRRTPENAIEEHRDESWASEGLLAGPKSYSRKLRRKRTWYSYCVFCGISGLSILASLLIFNIALILVTAYWDSDFDPALQNWGTKGSGTEGLAWYPTDFTKDILPIPCHSHNDYWRRVPLFSALRAGCTGTEADVWLYDSDLYVGHNRASLTRNRTFQSLYVNPLVKILSQQNPHSEFYNGSMNGVFDTDPSQSLILLIDVKTSGKETWPWVLAQLEPLRERGWLTFMENGKLNQRPITVVGTGNTPFDVLTANATYRDAFFDAPLELMWEPRNPGDELLDTDTESNEPLPSVPSLDAGQGMTGITANSSFTPLNSYYASVKFGKSVGILWRGKLTNKQLKIIRGHVRGAHRRGLKVRYWDLPGWPVGLRNHVWDVLVKEGVDVLNVDDLRGVGRLSW